MDISKLDLGAAASQARPLELKHPVYGTVFTDEEDKKPVLMLLGARSPDFKAAMSRTLAAAQTQTLEESEKAAARNFAAITTGWRNIEWDDEPLKFTRSNAEMLYLRMPWIRQQIDGFISDDRNFWEEPEIS